MRSFFFLAPNKHNLSPPPPKQLNISFFNHSNPQYPPKMCSFLTTQTIYFSNFWNL